MMDLETFKVGYLDPHNILIVKYIGQQNQSTTSGAYCDTNKDVTTLEVIVDINTLGSSSSIAFKPLP